MPEKYGLRTIERLGYVDRKPSPAQKKYIRELCAEAHEAAKSDLLTSNYVANKRLSTVWHNDSAASTIHAVIDDPEIRFAIESLLTADHNPRLVHNAVKESLRKIVPREIIQLYSHLVWDLRSLSKWEIDMLFETHLCGNTYRVVYSMGHQVALLYSGTTVDVDKEEELKFMRAAAAAKFREVVVTMDAGRGAAPADKWAGIFMKINEQLGPMDMIRKLIDKMQSVEPAKVVLDSADFHKLESVSGLTHGIAMLGDLHEKEKADATDAD